MLELADEADSKSVGSDTVRVRPPPPAPVESTILKVVLFCFILKLSYKLLNFNKKWIFKVDLVKDIYYNK